LYTKGGTTGIARVNTYDSDFNVWVHVAVLKTIKSIYPFYLQHVLNSYHCYRQSQKYTHGVGNQDFGLTRMILITLPICSFSEQQAVVREIETRLSVCDKIEQDIQENLGKAEALRQSILKKAFEGKLLNDKELAEVRKEEDWEPAEVLLERIKAEREENGKCRKQIPEQSKKIIRDEKGFTQQATLQVFEQVDN
jgi:type I restriction enzyme S subunit